MLAPLVWLAVVTVAYARGTPPSISVPKGNKWPSPVVYIIRYDVTSFLCQAISDPPAKYYWIVNGTKVNIHPKVITYNEMTGVLTIGQYFRPQHYGDYQCVAFNEYGKTMTPFLNIQGRHTMSNIIEPDETSNVVFGKSSSSADKMKSDRYNYLKMKCISIPFSVLPWEFSWTRYGPKVNDTYLLTPDKLGNRMIIDPEGNLHFLWTEMSDNDCQYRCAVKNEVLLVNYSSPHFIMLTVNKGDYDRRYMYYRAPELKYHKDVEVRAGDTAKLTCIFSYYSSEGETISVSWYFRGDKVGEGSILTIPHVHLPNVTENQEGVYRCVASMGNYAKVWGTVRLKVVAPPKFIPDQEPRRISIPKESNAVFKCGTTSHNSHSRPPVWLVNTEPLLGCPPRFFECKTPMSNGYSQCIEERYVCDNSSDCTDQSDEHNCPASCPTNSEKRCDDQCIHKSSSCPELLCVYPDFMCHDTKACLQKIQVCDGISQCKDGSDELACPNKQAVTRNRFTINSERTELTLPNVSITDVMCIQCMVTNDYGTVVGDGSIIVECPQGYFGENCSECPCKSVNTQSCHIVTGECCKQGWSGKTCSDDTDECKTTPDICKDPSTCVNTPGSYLCVCPVGMYMKNFTDGFFCEDLRETGSNQLIITIPSSVGGVGFLVIFITVVVCCVRRHKGTSDDKRNARHESQNSTHINTIDRVKTYYTPTTNLLEIRQYNDLARSDSLYDEINEEHICNAYIELSEDNYDFLDEAKTEQLRFKDMASNGYLNPIPKDSSMIGPNISDLLEDAKMHNLRSEDMVSDGYLKPNQKDSCNNSGDSLMPYGINDGEPEEYLPMLFAQQEDNADYLHAV